MKGKRIFTELEIEILRGLIKQRIKASRTAQKAIRQRMRTIGLYGMDDWGIRDLQISDLEWLIKSGRITVLPDEAFTASQEKTITPPTLENQITNIDESLINILQRFASNCFDPAMDDEAKLPKTGGNYIICLKKGCKLPAIEVTPTFSIFNGLSVIYTGIAKASLRDRDYKQHFKGNNAGRSTLRKSLGVLFGFRQIARDVDPTTGKTKFRAADEEQLTRWMCRNLLIYFFANENCSSLESRLIYHFNPPLNLNDNYNGQNGAYRVILSSLRKART